MVSNIHVLEAGYETKGRPAVLLLHGYPELAWSWRKILPVLGAAGYHAIAPDHRGYGRTSSTPIDYDRRPVGLPFPEFAARRDRRALRAGTPHGRSRVGHDFGAAVASFLALVRPTSSSAWC